MVATAEIRRFSSAKRARSMTLVPDHGDWANGHPINDLTDTRGDDGVPVAQTVGDDNTVFTRIAQLNVLPGHPAIVIHPPDDGIARRTCRDRGKWRKKL